MAPSQWLFVTYPQTHRNQYSHAMWHSDWIILVLVDVTSRLWKYIFCIWDSEWYNNNNIASSNYVFYTSMYHVRKNLLIYWILLIYIHGAYIWRGHCPKYLMQRLSDQSCISNYLEKKFHPKMVLKLLKMEKNFSAKI